MISTWQRLGAIFTTVFLLGTAEGLQALPVSSNYEVELVRQTRGKELTRYTIPLEEAQKLPVWTPYNGTPAPLSLIQALVTVQGELKKIAGAHPVHIQRIKLAHGRNTTGSNIWFYFIDTSITLEESGKIHFADANALVLLDGRFYMDPPEGLVPVPTVELQAEHPSPGTLPDTTDLATLTEKGITSRYPITAAQILAQPQWSFASTEAPPFTLEQALDLARKKVAEKYPGEVWSFTWINLSRQVIAGHELYYYEITVHHAPVATPYTNGGSWRQIILLDGTWVEPVISK